MKRYKITIEYDGTNYLGWQRQKDGNSIQKSIEKAVESFSGQKATVTGSGRTDAGVHALGQVAHFDLESEHTDYRVMMALNHYLKDKNIVILGCETVDEKFHARFSAKKRFYKYRILNKKQLSPLRKNRVWEVRKELNIEKMQNAADLLIGEHDFTSFRDSDCQAKSPIKSIDEISIYRKKDEIIFEISAKSFLHHMVRNIVGTLRDVGIGKTSIKSFQKILEAKDRTKAGVTAPACGLYFVRVGY